MKKISENITEEGSLSYIPLRFQRCLIKLNEMYESVSGGGVHVRRGRVLAGVQQKKEFNICGSQLVSMC